VDSRRLVPRTDSLLADPRLAEAERRLGRALVKAAVGRLRELGLDGRALWAAVRAGLLLRVTEQIVLAPGAEAEAARALAGLPQPFTAADARQALGTTRRVAIPLPGRDHPAPPRRPPPPEIGPSAKKIRLRCIGP
jgi:hypothetical protein